MNEITWLSHGGKNSGWTRENGHVPGSQGGKIYKLVSKKKRNHQSESRTVSGVSKPKNKSTPKKEKSQVQKATDAIREDTAYRKALAENQRIRNPKLSPDKLTTAATKFKDASKYMDDVSKGVSNAWNDLHNAKYRNKDRSKEVKDLSNAELQNVIARIKLEQEYNRITMPQKKSGYDKTMAALSVIGTAATVTATGLSIAAGVKALRRQ